MARGLLENLLVGRVDRGIVDLLAAGSGQLSQQGAWND